MKLLHVNKTDASLSLTLTSPSVFIKIAGYLIRFFGIVLIGFFLAGNASAAEKSPLSLEQDQQAQSVILDSETQEYQKYLQQEQQIHDRLKMILYAVAGLILLTIAWNITLRKILAHRTKDLLDINQQLRDSALRLQMIVEAGNIGLWDWDLRTHQVGYSTEWKRQIGYEDHEINTDFMEWQSRIHPDDRDHILLVLQTYIQQPSPTCSVEFRFRHKNGCYRWILAQGSLIHDTQGEPLRMLGSHIDITERKQAEEELRESQLRFQHLVENLPAGAVYIKDGMIFINRAAEVITGYSRNELITLDQWFNALYGADSSRIRQYYENDKSTGFPQPREVPLTRKDHQVCWMEFSAYHSERDEEIWLLQDITERKRAEEELRFQAMVLNQIQDQVTVTDLNGIVTYVNDAVCQILKRPREAIVGHSVESYGDDPVLGETQRQIVNSTLTQGEWRGNVVNYATDGSIIVMDCRTRLMRDQQGLPVALCGISTDITERRQAEESLRRSEQQYRAVIETSQDGFWMLDPQGHLLEVNEAYRRMSGYSRDELLRMSIFDLDNDETPAEMAIRIEKIIGDGGDLFQARHRTKCGRIWEVEVNTTYWPIEEGRFFVFIRDIHRRQRSEALLKVRMQLSEIALTGSLDDLLQAALDATERFTGSQIGFFHFVDPDQENLTLQTWSTNTLKKMCQAEGKGLHYPVSQAGVWVDCVHERRPVIHNDYASLLHRKGLPEGHAQVIRELTVPILRNDQVVAIIGVGNKPEDYTDDDVETVQLLADLLIDAVERRRAEDRIAHLAYHDALTQLPNRVLLTDRLQQAMAQTERDQKRLAVCYLDVDNFKPINDAWSHAHGDRLLVEVAQRLKNCVRAGDTVARLGGDEFVLLLGDLADVEECEHALDRVTTTLRVPFTVSGQPLLLTASLGVTLFPDDASDPDTLLRHTDQAMYVAKQAGGNRYQLFDADDDRRARHYRDSLRRIEEGLAAGELRLYYQPKVDMRRGTVIGAEALIRWQHPGEGLLPPARFMPAVEACDLAIAVGQWVINEALRQMTVWAAQGLCLTISVNISSRHLQQPDFVAELRAALLAHPEAPPERLELEILETVALEDMASISRLIEDCRQLGVRFALDDFGTGYSSLTYLKHLAVHLLKIDQSFVRDLLVDAEARAIVEGVIGLSAAFRRGVIAEGVETNAHGSLLIQLGCDLAQGYGIARPMPPESLPAWVANWMPPSVWMEAR